MLAIEVEFLTGRYVATAHDDRNESEWPPHPARLFSALVATWAETDEPAASERSILERLESLAAPLITASDAARRAVVTHFVPVNDAAVVRTYDKRVADMEVAFAKLAAGDLKPTGIYKAQNAIAKARDVETYVAPDPKAPVANALALLPSGRGKQARTYPSVTPTEPRVIYSWPTAELEAEERSSLDELLGRVVRVGHSSSFVACRLVDETEPTLVPERGGGHLLRWVGEGQLEALKRAYDGHKEVRPRTLPSRGVRYQDVRRLVVPEPEPLVPDMAGGWLAFEFAPTSRRLSATTTLSVARAFRAAVLSYPGSAHPEVLCGHMIDNSPTKRPHVSFVPLPFVGQRHASGTLMAIAVLLPSDPALAVEARRALGRVIKAWNDAEGPTKQIRLGSKGILLGDFTNDPDLKTSSERWWAGPSKTWVSVTPIALSSNPGKLQRNGTERSAKAWEAAEQSVIAACRHVGLPEPANVSVGRSPLLAGVLPADKYPAYFQFDRRQGRDLARAFVHASVTFEQPVRGPLLLGSGRYFGLGLMYPIRDTQALS